MATYRVPLDPSYSPRITPGSTEIKEIWFRIRKTVTPEQSHVTFQIKALDELLNECTIKIRISGFQHWKIWGENQENIIQSHCKKSHAAVDCSLASLDQSCCTLGPTNYF